MNLNTFKLLKKFGVFSLIFESKNYYDTYAVIKHNFLLKFKIKNTTKILDDKKYSYYLEYNYKISDRKTSCDGQVSMKRIKNENSKCKDNGNILFFDSMKVARDNAEYMYEYYQERNYSNIYYVLYKDSIDIERLENKNFNILIFGSKEFDEKYKELKTLYTSHLGYHIINYKNMRYSFKKTINTKCVFIPHGLTRGDRGFLFDRYYLSYFVCSTENERNIINNTTLLYDNQIIHTGYPRTDVRKNGNRTKIFYAPTHSVGYKTKSFDHEYKFSWLFDEKINNFLEEKNLKIEVLIHSVIASNSPELISKLETNNNLIVQKYPDYDEALSTGKLLITDYSSVFTDFMWENVPIGFYQKEKYHHDDVEMDYSKYGQMLENTDDIMNFIDNPMVKDIEKSAMTFTDRKNRERIYNIIEGKQN